MFIAYFYISIMLKNQIDVNINTADCQRIDPGLVWEMSQSLQLVDPFRRLLPTRPAVLLNKQGQTAGLIVAVQHSISGHWLASVSVTFFDQRADKQTLRILVWDLIVGQVVLDLGLIESISARAFICSMAFETDGSSFDSSASALYSTRLVLYLSTGQVIAFSLPDGKRLLSLTQEVSNESLVYADNLVQCLENGTVRFSTKTSFEIGERITAAHASASLDFVNNITINSGTADGSRMQMVVAGGQSGTIHVLERFSLDDCQVSHTIINTGCSVQWLAISPTRRWICAVMRDRTVRLFRRNGNLQWTMIFNVHDPVNRWQFQACGWGGINSTDDEVFWASVFERGKHLIHMYSLADTCISNGLDVSKSSNLAPSAVLDATGLLTAGAVDLVYTSWRSLHMELITVAVDGSMLLWKPSIQGIFSNWAALMPGMTAIDQCVQYVEEEDDFDLAVIRPIISGNGLSDKQIQSEHVDVYGDTQQSALVSDPRLMADHMLFSGV